MVRERIGGRRLAPAGVVAGVLVIALVQTGITTVTFDAIRDRLFRAPMIGLMAYLLARRLGPIFA